MLPIKEGPEAKERIRVEVGFFDIDKTPEATVIHPAFLSQAVKGYASPVQMLADVIDERLLVHGVIVANATYLVKSYSGYRPLTGIAKREKKQI